jgi:hypothetical protein
MGADFGDVHHEDACGGSYDADSERIIMERFARAISDQNAGDAPNAQPPAMKG